VQASVKVKLALLFNATCRHIVGSEIGSVFQMFAMDIVLWAGPLFPLIKGLNMSKNMTGFFD
jgi:hypothetical protein